MFLQYYGLREQPFGVTPDPRFLYMGAAHQEAYSSLLYGIRTGRGFMALIAPPGLGKTTVLFRLLESLQELARTMFLFQTNINSAQVIRNLIADLGVEPCNYDLGDLQRQFGDVLFRETRLGKRVVLAIDEAQNLDDSVLEMIRMLSNYESREAKLLQIVMAGQPQLADKLASPHLEQLHQRLAIVTRCLPFEEEEVPKYIHHRLRVAGYTGGQLFTPDALQLIVSESKGIPRTINNLCFQSLSLGCASRQKRIELATVQKVLADLDLESLGTVPSKAPEEKPQGNRESISVVVTGQNKPPEDAVQPSLGPLAETAREVAGLSAHYAWAKHEATIGESEIPTLSDITSSTRQSRRALLTVLVGLVAFLAGLWASPRIKLDRIATEWRSHGSITKPIAGLGRALRVPTPANPGKQAAQPDPPTTPAPLPEPSFAPPAVGAPSPALSPSSGATPPKGTFGVNAAPRLKASNVEPGLPVESGETLAGTGRVGVLANFSGRISIDGRSDPSWKTPHVFSLKPGIYLISVSSPGGVAWKKAVRVDAGENQWVVAKFADNDPALLTVDSEPPGLQVVVDGKAYGPSRVDVVLPPGPHELRVLLGHGVAPFVEKFQLKPGEAVTKRIIVRRRPASQENSSQQNRTPSSRRTANPAA